jgi:sodium/hydrogen exchanger 8
MLFEPELFFFILLPPIIFEAGYSMKKAAFFYNVGTILLFAVFGTLVSTLVVGYGLFGLAKIGAVDLDADSPIECLIFGSLISAVDPVAVLGILTQSRLKSPLMYSLIFGESVLNDAVSIVLFNTFRNFHTSTTSATTAAGGRHAKPAQHVDTIGEFDHFTIGALFLDFLLVSVGSLWIGVLVGLICSFLFKNSNLSKTPDVEFTLIIFFAYTAYCLSEILGLSGIMSLFFCSIVLAHYNWSALERRVAEIIARAQSRIICAPNLHLTLLLFSTCR